MWRCGNCSETVDDDFDVCWNCCTQRGPNSVQIDDTPCEPDLESDVPLPPEMLLSGGMTRREVATIICKTLALLMFTQAAFLSIGVILLVVIELSFAPFRGWTDWHVVYTSVILAVPTLSVIIVGVIYWKNAYAIAGKMVSADPTPVTSHSLSISQVMIVAFSTAGIFIFVDGICDLVGIVYMLHRHESYALAESGFWSNPRTMSSITELGLGMWLILGSRGIIRVILWLRTAGAYEPTES